jgi:formylglycine-generating enzyme
MSEDRNQQREGTSKMKRMKWTVTGIMLAVAMLGAGGAGAGSLTPPGEPGSTMHTLEEIYQRIGDLEARLDAAGIVEAPEGMVLIPAGSFVMGDTFGEGWSDELPLHTNSISAFYMDATEVTKAKWDEVYNWAVTNGYSFDNTGSGKATDHPVHTVNWYDCTKWANARSEMEGLTACYTLDGEICRTNNNAAPVCDWSANGYRLPTEAEWEKAARGGAASRRFPWSDTSRISHSRANYYAGGGYSYDDSDGVYDHPDYDEGGFPYTSPVGSFAPNGYGLYDMAGNVWEWCWDRYGSTYYASSPGTDPQGPASGSNRVYRGGFWSYDGAYFCRVAVRGSSSPSFENDLLGFRLVRAAQ